MKITKRDRRSRIRGRRSCGWGRRQKHRGKGSKGGKGMAGTGKRAAQKRTYILKFFPNYFGKKGFKSLRNIKGKKLEVINLDDISRRIGEFSEKGVAKKINDAFEINLQNFKILGNGEIKIKANILAGSASKKAVEKIKSAGGTINTQTKE